MRLLSGAVSSPDSTQATSKQEKARKRNFNDLVDMTQVSDGDDDVQKKRKEDTEKSQQTDKATSNPFKEISQTGMV